MSKRVSVNSFRGVLLVMLLAGSNVSVLDALRTTEGVFTEEASPEKALEERVALARQYIGDGNWESCHSVNLTAGKGHRPQ